MNKGKKVLYFTLRTVAICLLIISVLVLINTLKSNKLVGAVKVNNQPKVQAGLLDKLDKIYISKPPTKTDYEVGENFDPTGMVVKATYKNRITGTSTTEEITNYTVVDGTNLKTGTEKVTISFTDGETRTTTQSIRVKTLRSIIVTKQPYMTDYYVGENFNPEGMEVKATFNFGDNVVIDDYTIVDGENIKEGQTKVTLRYTLNGVTAETTVKIYNPLILKFNDANLFSNLLSYVGRDNKKIKSIDEENLEAAISHTLIDDVTSLRLKSDRIEDITGLENFVEIKTLYLEGNNISSITPLSSLTKITLLDVSNNNISDITAIGNMKEIYNLDLRGNKISDISILSDAYRLNFFYASNNIITSMDVIAELEQNEATIETSEVNGVSIYNRTTNQLRELDLGNNQIETICDLSGCNLLYTLKLNNNKIRDISEINDLIILRYLDLSNNMISDISTLDDLPRLKTLILDNNQIDDISVIKASQYISMPSIETFSVKNQKLQHELQPGETEVELPKIFLQAKDNTTMIYTEEEFTFENCSLSEDGTKVMLNRGVGVATVKINGGNADGTTFTIGREQEEKELKSISITNPPDKTQYLTGETFDPTGMVVTATYSDGSTENITDYTISPNGPLTIDYSQITISYTEDDITATTTQSITIKEVVTIQFEDQNMYNKIISQIENEIETKDDENLTIRITKAKLDSIVVLDLSNGYNAADEVIISNISGIEYFKNLKFLYLDRNQIKDISALANLTSLTRLDLSNNQIEDISVLANLTALQDLDLSTNQIEDISDLANLTSLTKLNLSTNQIEDISDLANLTALQDLDLSTNQIEDISDLANLTSLTKLNLSTNQIEDISDLANLTALTELKLYKNQIKDISSLSNLTSLTELYLQYNQIEDISAIANLTELKRLNFTGNKIKDINSLANLTALEYLDMQSNCISDISPINGIDIPQFDMIQQSIECQVDYTIQEFELPQIFIDAQNSESKIYSVDGLNTYGVQLSEDGTKVIIPSNRTSITIIINSGKAGYSRLVIHIQQKMVEEIVLNKESGTLNVGENEILEATIIPEDAFNKNSLVWSSSDESVAILSDVSDQETHERVITKKRIRAKGKGTAVITVAVNHLAQDDEYVKAEYHLTVLDPKIDIHPQYIAGHMYNFEVGKSEIFAVDLTDIPLSERANIQIEENPKFTVTGVTMIGDSVYYTVKFLEAGETQIKAKLEYNGKTYTSSYDFTIHGEDDIVLNNIEINGELTNSVFYKDDVLNQDSLDGISVIAIYSDGSTKDVIEDVEIYPAEPLKLTDDKITIRYTEDGITIEKTIDITVKELKEIKFNDVKMYNAMVEQLGDKVTRKVDDQLVIKMTQENIDSVIYLDLNDKKISDLSGIEAFKKLKGIQIKNNNISSLEPLSELTDIYYLYMDNNKVETLIPLAGFVNLRSFIAPNNSITNLEGILELSALMTVNLSGNNLGNAEDIREMTSLEELYLANIGMEDVGALSELVNLKKLNISSNNISDITALSSLNKLRELTISYNKIGDITPVSNIETLTKFYSYNQKLTQKEGLELPQIIRAATENGSLVYTERPLSLERCDIVENRVIIYDGETDGTITIKGGNADGTKLTVTLKEIVRLEKEGDPKVEYIEGESFDPLEMKVYGVYDNGDRVEITNYEVLPETLSVGDTKVTIRYAGKELDVEGITVTANSIVRLEKEGDPKVEYIEGESFDPLEMKVYAIYNNGDRVEVTDYTIEPNRPLEVTDDKVVIRYEENGEIKEIEIPVTVREKELTGIEITKGPDKTEYTEGESFDRAGMEVVAIYNNGERVVIENYEIEPEGPLSLEDTVIKVKYEGKEDTLNIGENGITINPKPEEEIEVEIDEELVVEEDGDLIYIKEIQPKTMISTVLEKIRTNGEIQVYDKEQNREEDFTKYATSDMKVRIVKGEKQIEYILVVRGDTNGDGDANFSDMLKINKHRLEKVLLEGAYLRAGNVNTDEVANFRDMLKINKYRLGKLEIL